MTELIGVIKSAFETRNNFVCQHELNFRIDRLEDKIKSIKRDHQKTNRDRELQNQTLIKILDAMKQVSPVKPSIE